MYYNYCILILRIRFYSSRLENFRCNFRWANSNTLLIGWVDTIRICVIRKRNSVEATLRALPGFIVDPSKHFLYL